MAKKIYQPKLLTPVFMAMFTNIFHKDTPSNPTYTPKYGVTMLFDKSQDLSEMKNAAQAAVNAAVANEWGGVMPATLENPFTDGDILAPGKEQYESNINKIIVKSTTVQKPKCMNASNTAVIVDEEEIYWGCKMRAVIQPSAWNVARGFGVKFYLISVQKVGEGERIGGGSGQELFTPVTEADMFGGIDPQNMPLATPTANFAAPATQQIFQQPTPAQQMAQPVYQAPRATPLPQTAVAGNMFS